MILHETPKESTIREFLRLAGRGRFSYRGVGSTAIGSASATPNGYAVDHTRVRLGEGAVVFATAKSALGRWQQMRLGWLGVWPGESPIRKGQLVATIARYFGFCWLNACRVVYVVDETDPHPRFGYAYGTLEDHVERGEERFLVEMEADGTVYYDILAFSRPGHILTRLGYPLVRRLQKRFGRESAAAMQRAVKKVTGPAIDDEAVIVR